MRCVLNSAWSTKSLPCLCRPATIRPAVVTPTKNARDTSRVEVLLAQKTSKQVFKAAEESAQSRATNKAIKQSGLWTDVQKVILQVQKLTPGNAAFAIYRLGCLNCFASRKRKAGIHICKKNFYSPLFRQCATRTSPLTVQTS